MELLRMLLTWPLRRDMVGGQLERQLCPVRRRQGDPAGVLGVDLPASELRIKGRELLDVARIEHDEFQSSCCRHITMVPATSDSRAGCGPCGRKATRMRLSSSANSAPPAHQHEQ